MKVLCKKIVYFIVLLIVVIVITALLTGIKPLDKFFVVLTDSKDYASVSGLEEIRPFIEKVQQQDGTTKLIVGDSMCQQMFNGLQANNPEYTIVGSNGAITFAGQYLLINEYLKNHKDVTDICIFMHPGSIGRTFDTTLGYQYVILPFGIYDLLKDLDDNTIEDMKSTYGSFFINNFIVKWMEHSAVGRKIYFNLLKDYGTNYEEKELFEIANQYVHKIDELCKEQNIKLHFYPSPVAENFKESMETRKIKFQNTWLGERFPLFFNYVFYFPDEQAKDGTHFSGEFATQSAFNGWIKEILKDSGLLESLKLE